VPFRFIYSIVRHLVRRLLAVADHDELIRQLLAENIVYRQKIVILERVKPRRGFSVETASFSPRYPGAFPGSAGSCSAFI
jgi:hypothetical protein